MIEQLTHGTTWGQGGPRIADCGLQAICCKLQSLSLWLLRPHRTCPKGQEGLGLQIANIHQQHGFCSPVGHRTSFTDDSYGEPHRG